MKRAIVIVIDSFGVGAMEDVKLTRLEDLNSNTALSLINAGFDFPNLNYLGLKNILFSEKNVCKFGISSLAHFGADSYAGHQELMGTIALKPIVASLKSYLNELVLALKSYDVSFIEVENNCCLLVNNCVLIADNMETDFGQVINVSGLLDFIDFSDVLKIGYLVRGVVKNSRVITLGGNDVSLEKLKNALFVNGEYIGISTPKAGLYLKNYQVVHMGYGVDTKVQIPFVLKENNIKTYFYGKVGDIVFNDFGTNFLNVDSTLLLDELIRDLKKNNFGFYCLNIQETDLAGHSESVLKYGTVMNIVDSKLGEILNIIDESDLLIVMADHGNDPCIGHSLHTRENVPILVRYQDLKYVDLGHLSTLADVSATVCEYFSCYLSYGTSFLKKIN